MTYRKKLIEVALPLAAINAESAREKSIRPGHPSTLHLWWARRLLAACRAVLFSSLVDDPDSDPQFRKPDGSVDEEAAGFKRAELFNLIEELVKWENSNNPEVIGRARAEIARCVASRKIELGELKKDEIVFGAKKGQAHPKGPGSGEGITAWELLLRKAAPEVVNAFLAEHAPPVLDPFAGGGSIPLEAQRLGLRAYASDLNPVPVLINKALIEIPPKFAGRPPVNPASRAAASPKVGVAKGKKKQQQLVEHDWPGATGLAEDVRYYGQWMRDEAEKRIGHLYPKVEVTAQMAQDRPDLLPYVGQQLTVIAWLWARTVASPNPAANGAHVPLVRSFWLSTKKGKEAYVKPFVDRSTSEVRFEVHAGQPRNGFDPSNGTVTRNGGICLVTSSPIPLAHVRLEGKSQRLRVRLMAIVVDGGKSRLYLPASREHEVIAKQATAPDDIPDSDLPEAALGFRVQNYGMTKHRHLFTPRQLVALGAVSNLVRDVRERVLVDANGDRSYASAIALYVACAVGRAADYWSSLATWEVSSEFVGHPPGK